MLFKRRERATFGERFRVWLWPRVSWRRSATYFTKRTLRLSGTPYAIAMGCAAGAFVSFTPFLGLHFIIAIVLAWLLRGNLVAGALGTFVGNPLSFPLIWVSTYEVGEFIRQGGNTDAPALLKEASGLSFGDIVPLLEPMMIGAIPLGLIAGGIVYFLVYKAVLTYQEARRARLESRRAVGAAQ